MTSAWLLFFYADPIVAVPSSAHCVLGTGACVPVGKRRGLLALLPGCPGRILARWREARKRVRAPAPARPPARPPPRTQQGTQKYAGIAHFACGRPPVCLLRSWLTSGENFHATTLLYYFAGAPSKNTPGGSAHAGTTASPRQEGQEACRKSSHSVRSHSKVRVACSHSHATWPGSPRREGEGEARQGGAGRGAAYACRSIRICAAPSASTYIEYCAEYTV